MTQATTAVRAAVPRAPGRRESEGSDMDSYQLQAERETWEAIATQDAPPRRNGHLYRPMVAKYSGRCDSCGSRIAAGKTSIRYSSLAPRGSKVLCFPCFDGDPRAAQDA